MKIYVAGPMRGYADFNFPAFHAASAKLRAQGHFVFSPAEKDQSIHGADFCKGTDGVLATIEKQGFSLRRALGDDTAWICAEGDGVYLLKGWETSKGANAEKALAEALGLEIIYE